MKTKIKRLLCIKNEDKNELIDDIISLVTPQLLSYISEKELPRELEHIVIELSIIRYNRIASEGLASETSEAGSMNYEDDSFSRYTAQLDEYLKRKQNLKKGIMFI